MLYLFYGPETFLAWEQIRQISQKFDLVKRIDFSNDLEKKPLALLSAQLSQRDFFAPNTAFVFEHFLGSVGAGDVRGWIELLKKSQKSLSIIIWEKGRLNGGGGKLWQFLAKEARVIECKPLTRYQLKSWIRQRVKAQIESPAVEKLLALHQDLWALDSELKKLSIFAGDNLITAGHVQRLCVSTLEQKIFQLTDAFGERKMQPALAKLESLLGTGTNPNYILGMLVRQVRLLVLAEKGALEGVHPFVRKKVLAQSRLWQLSELKKVYQQLLVLDWQSKKGADINVQLLLFLGGRPCSDE